MWLPSLSVKSRTQPTWSDASSRSIAEGPTAGCQAEWLLKSRSTAHTRSIGASITADRRTRIIGSGRLSDDDLLQRVECRLEDALADLVGKRRLALGGAVELGPPFGKGPAAVRDRRELERGDVVLDPHRRLEDRVRTLVVVVRERQQALADHAAVTQPEIAHAPDAVSGLTLLDAGFDHERRPAWQAVEVAHLGPDGIGGRLDDARGVDLDHSDSCSLRSSSALAAWPTSPPWTPISRNSWSMSGAWARKRSAEFTTLS